MLQLLISPKTAYADTCVTLVMPPFANQAQCVSCVERKLFAFLHRCRHTSYHRQTKDHWARDDPAFVVILAGIVAVTSAAYAAACVQSG